MMKNVDIDKEMVEMVKTLSHNIVSDQIQKLQILQTAISEGRK